MLAPARPLAVHLPLVVVAQGLGDDLAAFSHLLVVAPSRRRRARVTAGEILPPPRSRLNRRIVSGYVACEGAVPHTPEPTCFCGRPAIGWKLYLDHGEFRTSNFAGHTEAGNQQSVISLRWTTPKRRKAGSQRR